MLGVAVPAEREDSAWSEGVAIWVAVLVVSLVGAFNDWNKDRQFQKLNAQKDVIDVKVIRDGQQLTVPNTDVVVGDVMLLDTGDKIVADGYVIEVGRRGRGSACSACVALDWGRARAHACSSPHTMYTHTLSAASWVLQPLQPASRATLCWRQLSPSGCH